MWKCQVAWRHVSLTGYRSLAASWSRCSHARNFLLRQGFASREERVRKTFRESRDQHAAACAPGLWALALCMHRGRNVRGAGCRTQGAEIVISATRLPIPEEESPAEVSVITAEEFDERQIAPRGRCLARSAGPTVVQTGSPGQFTSVFTRGLRSEHTQVLLDGIPINQGLAGLFNFADLTMENIERIEVVRGPQSTIYGPRALAGVIQIFTQRGQGDAERRVHLEGGTFDTFRESLSSCGSCGTIRLFGRAPAGSTPTTSARTTNTGSRNAIANLGWSPNERCASAASSLTRDADTGNPNTIFAPRPRDNFLTERWLVAPRIDFTPVDWWRHQLIAELRSRAAGKRSERGRLRRPDPRALQTPHARLSERLRSRRRGSRSPPALFYSQVDAGQERPFVSSSSGRSRFISDQTEQPRGVRAGERDAGEGV